MKFTDFQPEELIGKKVLYESSDSANGTKRGIRIIERITKTGFAIAGVEGLFDFKGNKKGVGGGRTNWSTHISCELITEETAKELAAKWALAKRVSAAKKALIEEAESGRPTLEQLEAACKALGLTQ